MYSTAAGGGGATGAAQGKFYGLPIPDPLSPQAPQNHTQVRFRDRDQPQQIRQDISNLQIKMLERSINRTTATGFLKSKMGYTVPTSPQQDESDNRNGAVNFFKDGFQKTSNDYLPAIGTNTGGMISSEQFTSAAFAERAPKSFAKGEGYE